MTVVIAIADLLMRSRVEAAAVAAGHAVEVRRTVPLPGDPAPDLLVLDLDMAGAPEALEQWRNAHLDAAVTGLAFHVNAQVIEQARALGVRVVAHGADPATLF